MDLVQTAFQEEEMAEEATCQTVVLIPKGSRAPPPARATLERITAERVDLYSYVTSPGENIPATVAPAEVDDRYL